MDRQKIKTEAKQKIDDLFKQLDHMEQKKEQVKSEAKGKYSQYLEDMKARKKEVQDKYRHLEQVSEEKWNEAQKDFQKSSSAFSEGVSKLKSIIG